MNFNTLTSLDLEGNLDLESFLDKIYLMPSFKLAELNLSRTYLSAKIIARIFLSPQIIYLRNLSLNCNPIVKEQIINQLKNSLHTKNLKNLEMRNMNFNNNDLLSLSKGKWLGDFDKLDLRCNSELNLNDIILCEGNELEGIKSIRSLLMDNDSMNPLDHN